MKRSFSKQIFYFLILILISFIGCDDKLDLSLFPISNNQTINISDTVYVQQYPVWTQFNAPEDVLVGWEPLIYVADTKNNRIVQLDLAGGEIGTLDISGVNVNYPRRIAQDYNFDLLVLCDSAISSTDTVTVLYRIKLVEVGGIISNAHKKRIMSSLEGTVLSSNKRRFTGISVFPDNSYILTRTGPDNSGIDPDNALLRVRGRDTIQNVFVYTGFQTTGGGIYSIEKTSSVKVVRNSQTDFIITRNTPEYGFKVEWFVYDDVNGTYEPKFLPGSDIDLIKKQFGAPMSVAMDNYMNIFIVDAAKDSLYKYSSNGKLQNGSFGGRGSGENQLNSPKGVAFFNKVLYIADTGNNRIVRFKLSTDIN